MTVTQDPSISIIPFLAWLEGLPFLCLFSKYAGLCCQQKLISNGRAIFDINSTGFVHALVQAIHLRLRCA